VDWIDSVGPSGVRDPVSSKPSLGKIQRTRARGAIRRFIILERRSSWSTRGDSHTFESSGVSDSRNICRSRRGNGRGYHKRIHLQLLNRCLLQVCKALVDLVTHITASIEIDSELPIGLLNSRSILKSRTILEGMTDVIAHSTRVGLPLVEISLELIHTRFKLKDGMISRTV